MPTHTYCDARDDERPEEAATILAGISDYNEYDCLSTLELRNWLLGLAKERGWSRAARSRARRPARDGGRGRPARSDGPDDGSARADAALAPAELALMEFAEPGSGLSEDDRKAVAMLAAAVSYHRRERKSFWWAHFDRCENGPDTHRQRDRNVFLVEAAEILDDWQTGRGPSFRNGGSS